MSNRPFYYIDMSSSSKISVCALTLYSYDTCPGQRFRIEQWQPLVEAEGITIDYFPFADEQLQKVIQKPKQFRTKATAIVSAFARQLINVLNAKNYDVVFIYRAATMIGPAVLERLLRFYNRPIILDFDDAIFLTHTSEANKKFGWLKFSGKTATLCRLSSSVTVGNSYLAEYARQYNSNVTIIPSGVDTDKFTPSVNNFSNDKVIIGWTGSSTSQTHLEAFTPMIRKLLLRRGDVVEFHVHSDREPNMPGVAYKWHPWSSVTEVEEISRFDIGIMPMPDDEWSRGKCAMKALLYMSLGIPAVCSDIGANRDVIIHRENGFLVSTEDQWLTHLETLIDNKDLRLRLGRAARETVVENYSMKKCAKLFARTVKETVEQR